MKVKEIKGITLIALAITVVVLIILAGVSINAVVGDDGIIKKAHNSANLTRESEAKEIINRAVVEFRLTDGYDTLEDFLKTKVSAGTIDSVVNNGDGTLNVSKNGYTLTVENKTKKGSSSKGDNNDDAEPTLTVGTAKVVADSTGTGDALGEASTYLGNTLYITFSHSITGGTTTVEPSIPYAVTANGTYKFTVTGTVNGKSYTKEVSVTVNQFKDTYEYMDKNTEVTYPDGKVWVPEGFKIADDSSDNIQGGVVIEDKDGNQFVWVPVDKIDDYKRTAYAGDVATETIDSTTNSIKISSGRYYYTEALPDDEKNSVTTYKGFYIGRYEAGDKESTGTTKATFRTGGLGTSNSVTIKADQVPYDHVTRDEAVSLAEGFKKQQNYNDTLTTKLVSSYAWDTTIAFMQKTENEYGESSPQGNYKDTTFTYKDITDENKTEQIKDEDSELLVATGQTTPVCNIYDMGGNVYEWTSEVTSKVIPNSIQYYYTHRGSCYQNNYVSSAGTRMFSSGIVISQHRLQNCFIFVDKCNSCSKQG